MVGWHIGFVGQTVTAENVTEHDFEDDTSDAVAVVVEEERKRQASVIEEAVDDESLDDANKPWDEFVPD